MRSEDDASARRPPTEWPGGTSSDDPPDDARLSLGAVYALLAKRRRRYVLYCLYRYANPMTLPDVAEQVTEWEHGEPGDELLDERLYIYNELYHTHVPKLADADVVAYSQSEDVVELDRNAARLRPILESTIEDDLAADGASQP